MKFLILLLVLSIGAQPLQAGVCDMDMEKSQDSSRQMQDSDSESHDCCDSDDSDEPDIQQGCTTMLHCGSCNAAVSTMSGINRFDATWVSQYSPALSTDNVLPSHSTPLFRPPIPEQRVTPAAFTAVTT